jgi:ABC-type multidrug transport system ATPase subunit
MLVYKFTKSKKRNTMELLTLNEISKNIKSKKNLKDVSFTLNSGDIIGLVGGNGAGKTTLMKVILDEPMNGLDPKSVKM